MNPVTALNNFELKSFLDEKVAQYNRPDFIPSDPISVPHDFELKEDIEIAGFLSATIAWGNRTMIVRNAKRMVALMGESPFSFVMESNVDQQGRLAGFVHRTFNGVDFQYFIQALKHIYINHGGLEGIFTTYSNSTSTQPAISQLKNVFFELEHPLRTTKHISDPAKGSSAKRINMFLRWMVRDDGKGVDFGIWKDIPMSALSCPLDVHSGNTARQFGLLHRTQNDSKALAELDASLRVLDSQDPVKYDFALFGLGAIEKF